MELGHVLTIVAAGASLSATFVGLAIKVQITTLDKAIIERMNAARAESDGRYALKLETTYLEQRLSKIENRHAH